MNDGEPALKPKDLRLLLPGLAGWACAALGIWLRPGWIGIALCAVFAVASTFLLRRKRRSLLTQLLLIPGVCALMFVSVFWGERYREQPDIAQHAGAEVNLVVSLNETFTPGTRSLGVTIRQVAGKPLDGPGIQASLVGANLGERTPYGSTAGVRGYLQLSEPWEREGWTILARGDPDWVSAPGWFLSGSDVLRMHLVERAHDLGGDGGRLLPGLAIGDTSAVDRGLVQAMRDTSLSHLVAVSGANCAIVVAIVVGLIHLVRGGVWAKLIGGSLALAGFVTVVTPEPSIVRASLMATIVLLFLALGKPLKGIPVLALTVVIILAADPWMAADFAFVLSVLASGGILLLVGPVSDAMSSVMPSWMATVLAIPIAAQVACQPVLILLNPVVPLWSVIANALAAPIAPLATILGMLVGVLGPFLPGLSDIVAWVAWWPSSFVAFVGRFFASLSWVTVPFPSGVAGALLMAGLAWGGITFLLLRHPSQRAWRRLSGALATGCLSIVILVFHLPGTIASLSVPRDWFIAQCDVGQGDALLLKSEGRTLLIDTGKYPEKLRSCMSFLGVTHLDLAVISHFDVDHVGAWPVIADRVDQVWVGPVLQPDHRDIVRALESAGATVNEVSAGNSLPFGRYRLRVVWPLTDSFADAGNDSSVVVAVEPDRPCTYCLSGVFLGDLGEEPQRILLAREDFGSFDVVKVSHHGSRDQFEGLYQDIDATVGLIGVGEDNTYGHPTQRALDILSLAGTVPLRSDEKGIITLSPGEKGQLLIWSQR